LRQARAASGIIALETVVGQVRPTVLIGASTSHGAFTRQVVETMSAGTPRPVIFPVSNPTSQIEARPADVIAWTGGTALVATGLPIPPVDHQGVRYQFGQANNALLYPGLGLGTIVSGASKVTDSMLLAAAEAVAGQADVGALGASLLPVGENLRGSSATTAIAVARAAADDGVATMKTDELVQGVQDAIWQPAYPDSVS
jgi:malate dehydrogenase (oxaloacetate-decarboxylating)